MFLQRSLLLLIAAGRPTHRWPIEGIMGEAQTLTLGSPSTPRPPSPPPSWGVHRYMHCLLNVLQFVQTSIKNAIVGIGQTPINKPENQFKMRNRKDLNNSTTYCFESSVKDL